MQVLQLTFGVDYNRDEVNDAEITPLTIPLASPEAEAAAAMLIGLADGMDKHPNDGAAEISSQVSLPVLKLFGLTWRTSVILDATLTIVEV